MTMPIRIDFYTDPYCAWSWALEPEVREIERLEGAGVTWHLRMKPLIRDLAAIGATGEDIAHKWDHIAAITGADIDASLWGTRPPNSTLPADRATKIAARFGPDRERAFVHELRPMLMLQGLSADDEATLLEAARRAGIDVEAFRAALGDPAAGKAADEAIAEDERAAEAEGIKATPALVLRNGEGDRVVIEGLRDAELIRRAIQVLRTDQAVADAARERVTGATFIPEPRASEIKP